MITRHDIPAATRRLIDAAVATELLDPIDLVTLAVELGADWSAWIDRITEIAYANRHDMRRQWAFSQTHRREPGAARRLAPGHTGFTQHEVIARFADAAGAELRTEK